MKGRRGGGKEKKERKREKKEETTFRAIVMDKKAGGTSKRRELLEAITVDGWTPRLVDGRRRGIDKRDEELAETG